jgi:uncharacterized damage-inducible protein DinB
MDILDRLLGHDQDTTWRLLELSSRLDDALLDQVFDLGHGTLRKTLAHIVDNVETWTDLMNGWSTRPVRSTGESIPELTNRFEIAYTDLSNLADRVQQEGKLDQLWVDVLDQPPRQKTFGGAIVHVVTHSMHHRAQAIHMLKRLGVNDVPEGDAMNWDMARRG